MNINSNPTGDCDIDLWQRVLEEDTGAFEEVVVKYQMLFIAVTTVISVLPTILLRFAYRRELR